MKKVYFILIPLLLMGYLVIITLVPRTKPEKVVSANEIINIDDQESSHNKEKIDQNISLSHVNKSLSCKSCHVCEYPTKEDPCLLDCPRENILSSHHSPKEGPEIVVISEMSENYCGVVFSHKMHSEMSEFSTGCTGCHHFNTTGPVLNCRKCHNNVRSREDVSIPDLKAAFHRQCMTCHSQWSGDNGCNTQCHKRKNANSEVILKLSIQELKSKSHPILPKPAKMIWETNSDKGKIVTFFHDEHVQLFKLTCTDCHKDENCVKCHGSKTAKDSSQTVKLISTTKEQHNLCKDCHYLNNCKKCHSENELQPFNHGKESGWNLKSYHNKLECSKCHGSYFPYKKLDNDCITCHKNFTLGNFNHKATGLTLSENHKEIECNICHVNGNFEKNPVCTDCHDDKSYPADIPGKRK